MRVRGVAHRTRLRTRSRAIRIARREVPGRVIALAAGVVTSLVVCGVALWFDLVNPAILRAVVERAGALGVLAYVLASVTMQMIWLPRMWSLLVAGALFGPIWGLPISMAADTLSAGIGYGLARTGGRDWVSRIVAGRPRADRVLELFARRRGGVTVAFLRCTPIAHYTLVSYLAGLTGVRARGYFVGNTVGLLPGAIIYVTLGDGVLQAEMSPQLAVALFLLALSIVATLVVGRRVLRR